MGTASPGRWQSWHRFWRIGRTSLLNVPPPALVAATADTAKVRSTAHSRIRLLLSFSLFWCPEPRVWDRDVHLHVLQLNRIPAIQPREREPMRDLDSLDVAIVGVVNLRGNPADGRPAIAQLPQQQARLAVEVQRRDDAIRAVALHNLDIVTRQCQFRLLRRLAGRPGKILDHGRQADAPILEDLFDLSWES